MKDTDLRAEWREQSFILCCRPATPENVNEKIGKPGCSCKRNRRRLHADRAGPTEGGCRARKPLQIACALAALGAERVARHTQRCKKHGTVAASGPRCSRSEGNPSASQGYQEEGRPGGQLRKA